MLGVSATFWEHVAVTVLTGGFSLGGVVLAWFLSRRWNGRHRK